ncbi:hypothetical protein Leryth_020048, partial [Lithospermum erythrorhizon]
VYYIHQKCRKLFTRNLNLSNFSILERFRGSLKKVLHNRRARNCPRFC